MTENVTTNNGVWQNGQTAWGGVQVTQPPQPPQVPQTHPMTQGASIPQVPSVPQVPQAPSIPQQPQAPQVQPTGFSQTPPVPPQPPVQNQGVVQGQPQVGYQQTQSQQSNVYQNMQQNYQQNQPTQQTVPQQQETSTKTITMDDIIGASFGESSSQIKAYFKKTIVAKQYEPETIDVEVSLNMDKELSGPERMLLAGMLQSQIEYESLCNLVFKGFITPNELEKRKNMLVNGVQALKTKAEELTGRSMDSYFD